MNKMEDLVNAVKINDLLHKNEEKDKKCKCAWILAVVGAIAAVAGIAFAVYKYLTPKYEDDFEDDFDSDFNEDFFSDDDLEKKEENEDQSDAEEKSAESDTAAE